MNARAAWKNPRVLLILALVFLCGAVAGIAASRLFFHPPVTVKSVGPYWKEGGRTISLQNLKKELNLTPQQEEEIAIILDDFVMYYQTLQSQMDEVRASGKSRIMKVLHPDQRKKFEAMMAEWQQKLH